MYCSNLSNHGPSKITSSGERHETPAKLALAFEKNMHCHNVKNMGRVGLPLHSPYGTTYLFPLEQLFYEAGVDLVFAGHERFYERVWPVYNRRVCNGTVDPRDPYREPRAPVHLVIGTGVRAALLHYLTAGLLQTTTSHCAVFLRVQCGIVDSASLIND